MKPSSLLAFILLLPAGLFAQSALKPLARDGFVRLGEITADFENQPDAAQQKYAGKTITVYGRVGRLESGDVSATPLVVYLQREANPSPRVVGKISSADLPGQQQLQVSGDNSQAYLIHRKRDGDVSGQTPYVTVDQRVALRGGFKAFVAGDIVLEDAHILKKERERELLKSHPEK